MSKHKERASVMWLISKACKHEIPDDLREPYYRDHRDEYVFKPQITQGLANCELYSLALAHIYEDPNYATLNHSGVIQLLMRKGVSLVEAHMSALTETILSQNAPIRMNAHMIVIEAIMALYIKDILIADQVTEVVSRYYAIQNEDLPLTIEETALFWVNKSAQRLKQQAKDELARFENESLSYVPSIHEAQELAELGSGASLLALISLYCPDYINWTEICLKEQLTLEECMANLEMLQYFCAKYLPYDICFLDIEDFLRLQNAMKINLLAFIADLLYLFEIKPANCVRRVTSSEDHQLHQSIDHPATISDEEMRLSDNQALLAKGTPAQLRSSRSQLLSASQMKARSLRHTSWTELESDEMSGDHHDPRLYQQQKLAKYFQPHQHLREELHKPLLRSESTSSTLNKHPQRNLRKQSSGDNGIHDLAQELSSLRMDSNLEAGFYLSHDVNSNHVHNNNGPNDSIHPSASPISFAKLSKTKDNSINAVNSTTITTTTPSQSSTLSRPAINVAYSSNEYFDKSASEMDVHGKSSMPTETELGGQIMEIRLKLGEKRRQIEMGRRQQEDQWKTQRQGIGKEAFLKALKKEKLNCSGSSSLLYSGGQKTINSSHDHLTHHLDVSEMKENLENHSRNADTIKRSMDLLGNSCAVDFENGNTQILDSQRKLRNASFGQTSNGSNQFFLHADDISAEEAFLHNNTQQNSSLHLNKRFSDYINSTQAPQQQQLSQVDSEQKYLNYDHSTSNPLNGQSTNSPDEQISSQNNKDKGFFILFEDEKKPRSMPPSLRSRIKGKTEPTESPSVDNVTQMISTETPSAVKSIGFVIGPEPDPMSELEKAKKKEMIVIQSLKRRAEQESQRIIKEDELSKQREMERKKRESAEKRKEESRLRREAILEQYRMRKLGDESDKDGKCDSKLNLFMGKGSTTLRNRSASSLHRGRPKSIHVSINVQHVQATDRTNLLESLRASNLVSDHLDAALISYPSVVSGYSTFGSGRPQSSMSTNSNALKKLTSGNKPGHLPSLPSFLISNKMPRGSGSSDGVSEIGSTYSEYTGPKLYVKPAQKSNRGIIINAINTVLGGAVNSQTKKKVLEEINNNDSKNFLILFRGTGMQFRAIYSYNPDIEEIVKLHGTGPKAVNNDMMDKFYKYNSGAKSFNEVHTKHITVTIDAFTIHSVLWSAKRVLPPKKDSF